MTCMRTTGTHIFKAFWTQNVTEGEKNWKTTGRRTVCTASGYFHRKRRMCAKRDLPGGRWLMTATVQIPPPPEKAMWQFTRKQAGGWSDGKIMENELMTGVERTTCGGLFKMGESVMTTRESTAVDPTGPRTNDVILFLPLHHREPSKPCSGGPLSRVVTARTKY